MCLKTLLIGLNVGSQRLGIRSCYAFFGRFDSAYFCSDCPGLFATSFPDFLEDASHKPCFRNFCSALPQEFGSHSGRPATIFAPPDPNNPQLRRESNEGILNMTLGSTLCQNDIEDERGPSTYRRQQSMGPVSGSRFDGV